jgi:hypothetical protein
MEKENEDDGWKDVKKKSVGKTGKTDTVGSGSNTDSVNGCGVNNFTDYYNPSVKSRKMPTSNPNIKSNSNSPKKPQYAPLNIVEKKSGSNGNNSSNSSNNIDTPKYQPPSIKNSNNINNGSNNNTKPEGRGGYTKNNTRGGRGAGKWGKRFDVSSIPDFESNEEKVKFLELQTKCPHIVMPGTARRDAVRIRIDNYAEKMLSDEWIEFQCNGWKFVHIIKPDDEVDIPDEGFELLNLENKYNDFALFQNIG